MGLGGLNHPYSANNGPKNQTVHLKDAANVGIHKYYTLLGWLEFKSIGTCLGSNIRGIFMMSALWI